MSSPFRASRFSIVSTACATILLILTTVVPSAAFAADAALVAPPEPRSVPATMDAVPRLSSVDLTVRTGHMATAVQMTKTKIKDPTTTVVIVLVAVAVVVAILYVRYALSHGSRIL
jgi:hypothetical protein